MFILRRFDFPQLLSKDYCYYQVVDLRTKANTQIV